MKKTAREFRQVQENLAEFIHQIAYVGFIFAALFFIYNVRPIHESVFYTVFVIAHFTAIAASGYEIGQSSFEKSKGIRGGFIVFNIVFVIFTILVTKTLFVLALVAYMVVVGSIYMYITLHYIHGAYGKKDNSLYRFSHKHKNLFYIILLALPVIAITISLSLFAWSIYFKIGIVIVYVLSMPFIGMAAENGFDLEEVFLIGY